MVHNRWFWKWRENRWEPAAMLKTAGFEHDIKPVVLEMVKKPAGTSGYNRWLLAPGKNRRFLTGLKTIGRRRFLVWEPPVLLCWTVGVAQSAEADGDRWFWRRRSAVSITDRRSARPDALRAYYWVKLREQLLPDWDASRLGWIPIGFITMVRPTPPITAHHHHMSTPSSSSRAPAPAAASALSAFITSVPPASFLPLLPPTTALYCIRPPYAPRWLLPPYPIYACLDTTISVPPACTLGSLPLFRCRRCARALCRCAALLSAAVSLSIAGAVPDTITCAFNAPPSPFCPPW
ncbi:hypothetical protein DFH07DRAFT_768090 [Mycena maculata]|uniref:Uncharacterized protein n=1 Tax=Mycena maculata TaxID=230809 RepID=A0AAD7NRB3_9AGAR|nr:hypothetical protein DFH07DRAFT_768090 [Mycena maculata]